MLKNHIYAFIFIALVSHFSNANTGSLLRAQGLLHRLSENPNSSLIKVFEPYHSKIGFQEIQNFLLDYHYLAAPSTQLTVLDQNYPLYAHFSRNISQAQILNPTDNLELLPFPSDSAKFLRSSFPLPIKPLDNFTKLETFLYFHIANNEVKLNIITYSQHIPGFGEKNKISAISQDIHNYAYSLLIEKFQHLDHSLGPSGASVQNLIHRTPLLDLNYINTTPDDFNPNQAGVNNFFTNGLVRKEHIKITTFAMSDLPDTSDLDLAFFEFLKGIFLKLN